MRIDSKLLTWSSTYSVGIRVIDEQHRELINLINDMYNHVNNDESSECAYFKNIIHQIVDKIKIHFETEEKILIATKFRGYAEHKKTHDSFLLTVIENVLKFETGKKISLVSFSLFLKDWVLTHIAIMDKQYYEFLKKVASQKVRTKRDNTLEDIAC